MHNGNLRRFSSWTIQEIRCYLQDQTELDSTTMRELQEDGRKGVRDLVTRYLKEKNARSRAAERWQRLTQKERALQRAGFHLIAGVDEAGRGPLAGPVVAAAVVLHPGDALLWQQVNDSKRLTPRQRREQFELILRHARAVGIAAVEAEQIDRMNIHRASLAAMVQAVQGLKIQPDYLLTDGFSLPGVEISQEAITGGDALCLSIAAASIIAKVTRDEIMQTYSDLYRGYGFEKHKGYPTAAHKAAIKKLGLTPIHRRSFSAD